MAKTRSRLTFRAELFIRKRDEASGLMVSDRYFVPSIQPRRHPIAWILGNTLVLSCLLLGLLRLVATGFRVPVTDYFYPAAFGMCLTAAAFFGSEWCMRYFPFLAVPALLGWFAALFVQQDNFLRGARQFINLAVVRLNDTWTGSLPPVFQESGAASVPLFLVLLLPPIVVWLAAAVLRVCSAAMMELIVVPAVVALLLCGATGDILGCFILFFGVMLGAAFVRTRRQRRMWGGKNRDLYRRNRARFETIQKSSAMLVLLACLAISIPAFWLFRPMLGVSLSPAKALSNELQTDALNRIMKILPNLTAGQWNLNVRTVSGGVQDGSLISEGGYMLEGVEDLRLTLDRKPTDVLFLRGYIGERYSDGAWHTAPGFSFDGSAINWNTDGSPRLYIHNLPFLRASFAGAAGEASVEAKEPAQLFVERINANSAYTYVPYGAYLNSYYETEASDGTVSGQSEQEDRFFFFFREDLETVLQSWSMLESTASVLDRVEESYRVFCNATCLDVPASLAELQAEVDAVKAENRWRVPEDTAEISRWIRRYLVENCTWTITAEAVPEGVDPLEFFIFTSKSGSSVQFASAAVMLYRMFGIPARYVVGYEVPSTLFTVQAGGIYTAVAQGDNSQAWAEIYIPGIGWSPRDMTPGVIGTLEEIGPNGIRVEVPPDEEPDETEPEELEPEDIPEVTEAPEPEKPAWEPPTLEQVITWIAIGVGSLLLAVLSVVLIRRLSLDLGWSVFGIRKKQWCLLGVFQAVFRRTRRLKLPKGIDSQSEEFLAFLQSELHSRNAPAESAAAPALADLYRSIYGGTPVQQSDIRRMRSILLGLYRRKRVNKNP